MKSGRLYPWPRFASATPDRLGVDYWPNTGPDQGEASTSSAIGNSHTGGLKGASGVASASLLVTSAAGSVARLRAADASESHRRVALSARQGLPWRPLRPCLLWFVRWRVRHSLGHPRCALPAAHLRHPPWPGGPVPLRQRTRWLPRG